MNNYIFPFDKVSKASDIVLYGAGMVGQCFYKQIVTTRYCNVIAWIDKNYAAYADMGFDIRSFDYLSQIADRNVYVVIAINRISTRKEVKEEILSTFAGISESQIICDGDYSFPNNSIIECNDSELEKLGLLPAGRSNDAENQYNQRSLKNRRFLNNVSLRKVATVDVPVRDLILAQYRSWDFSAYQHYDMAVRLLACEEIRTGQENGGIDFYRRMQWQTGFDWVDRYKSLINNVDANGLDPDTKVELDRNLMIMDGSHRITLAHLLGIEFIKADIYECDRDRNFGIEFFWEHGFTNEECLRIRDRQQEILADCNYEFRGVIWPPAYEIADEILSTISQYGEGSVDILSYEDKTYTKEDFHYLFKAIYHPDILDDAGMELKFSQISNCMGDSNVYTIRYFSIRVNNPMIIINEKNNMPQSLAIKRLKKVIRSRLQHRISNYEYDVMVHISDNYYQSRFVQELFGLNRDVSDIMNVLNQSEYVAIKMYGRQHEKFPYYYWGDLDILVMDEDIDDIAIRIEEYMHRKFNCGWQNVEKRIMSDSSVLIWMKIRDLEVFGVHIQTVRRFDMNYEYNKFFISKRERLATGIYALPYEWDVYFRLVEYVKKPYKKHHLQFVQEYKEDISSDYIDKIWSENGLIHDKIEEFVKSSLRGNE